MSSYSRKIIIYNKVRLLEEDYLTKDMMDTELKKLESDLIENMASEGRRLVFKKGTERVETFSTYDYFNMSTVIAVRGYFYYAGKKKARTLPPLEIDSEIVPKTLSNPSLL